MTIARQVGGPPGHGAPRPCRPLRSWAAPAAICLGFLLVCLHEARTLNLWGDEAISFFVARQPWGRILATSDIHLPTYYLAIKLLLALVGAEHELALRMLHAAAFAVGLAIGHRTLLLLTGSAGRAGLGLLVAALVPALAFYATNIRMYSLLFVASMAFIHLVCRAALTAGEVSTRALYPALLAGTLMLQVDLPGLITYAAGAAALWATRAELRRLRAAAILLVPPLTLAAHVPILPAYPAAVRRWLATPGAALFDLPDSFAGLGSRVYQGVRPLFELTSIRGPWVALAMGLPIALAAWLAVAGVKLARGSCSDRLLLFWAFVWLPLAPLKLALPRAFLPSLFFMAAILVLPVSANRGWMRCGRPAVHVLRVAQAALIVLFLAVNIGFAVRPLQGLNSLVPYRRIASDVLDVARKEGIGTVLLSTSSGNYFSVRHYLEASREAGLNIAMLIGNERQGDLPPEPFLAVSFMGDLGRYADLRAVLAGSSRDMDIVGSYVALAELPYNEPFRRWVTRDARQSHAVLVYHVGATRPVVPPG